MLELAPSLLSANFTNLRDDIEKLNASVVKYLHLDIMDGNFVPNISYGPMVVESIRPLTDMVFDTHLMIENPEDYFDVFAKAGSDIITFHIETTRHSHRLVEQIHELGVKAGVSLNPSTPISEIEYILDDVDLVLIMTVNPGFGGQKYIETMDKKISLLAEIKKSKNLDFIIAVDGGIKIDNVERVLNLGANLIVSGSGVFSSESIESRIEEFESIFQKYR